MPLTVLPFFFLSDLALGRLRLVILCCAILCVGRFRSRGGCFWVALYVVRRLRYVVCRTNWLGCVLAGRLSQNPDVTIAVLEAGKARFGDALASE